MTLLESQGSYIPNFMTIGFQMAEIGVKNVKNPLKIRFLVKN